LKKRSKGFDRIICLELEKDPKSFDLLDEEAKKYYSDLMKDFNKLERSEFSVQEISENGDFQIAVTVKTVKSKDDFWMNESKIKAAMLLINGLNFENSFESEKILQPLIELIEHIKES